jgi:L-asparaginase
VLDAIRIAASDAARKKGVLVVMNNTIHAARHAVKAHTIARNAFRSGGIGPIGYAYPDRIEFAATPLLRQHIAPDEPVFSVDLIKFVVGMDDRHVRASIAAGAEAIVIEGSGLGNLNTQVLPGVLDALERGIFVTLCSRTGEGRVWPYYATAAGGASLAERGCLLSSLPGPKTRILLMLALGLTREPEALQLLLDPSGACDQ